MDGPFCLEVAPQAATLGGIREAKVGSCAVWLRGDHDTASVMQQPCESCFRILKIADGPCGRIRTIRAVPFQRERGEKMPGRPRRQKKAE